MSAPLSPILYNAARKYGLLFFYIVVIAAIGAGAWAYHHARDLEKTREAEAKYLGCSEKAENDFIGAMKAWCSIEDGSDGDVCRTMDLESGLNIARFIRARDRIGTVPNLINDYDEAMKSCDFSRRFP